MVLKIKITHTAPVNPDSSIKGSGVSRRSNVCPIFLGAIANNAIEIMHSIGPVNLH